LGVSLKLGGQGSSPHSVSAFFKGLAEPGTRAELSPRPTAPVPVQAAPATGRTSMQGHQQDLLAPRQGLLPHLAVIPNRILSYSPAFQIAGACARSSTQPIDAATKTPRQHGERRQPQNEPGKVLTQGASCHFGNQQDETTRR